MAARSGILLIDKPSGWTSHDVVSKLRGVLGERRIGHGGTLDPMATGLLVCFVGRATRAVSFVPDEKVYLAGFRTGFTTDTLDVTGTVTARSGVNPPESVLRAALERFVGPLAQIPPMVSALKKDGVPLYKLARRGETVERAPRHVIIHDIEWLGRSGVDWTLRVRCSAGTYIRSLVDDLGAAVGSGACLTSLRRERSGEFSVDGAVPPGDAGWDRLLPIDRAFGTLPAVMLSERDEEALRNGRPVGAGSEASEDMVRVYGADKSFLALGRVDGPRLLVLKSFFEVS